MTDPIILFGWGGIGQSIAPVLDAAGIKYLVVDNDPAKKTVGTNVFRVSGFLDRDGMVPRRVVLAMSDQTSARAQLAALGVPAENIIGYAEFLQQRGLSLGGFCQAAELEWLKELARAQQPGCRWVEVGTWKGESFGAVASVIPIRSTMIAVDTWPDDAVYDEWRKSLMVLRAARTDVELMEFRDESVRAAAVATNGRFDVVFLDADHSEEGLYADLFAWAPKVKAGGTLCGHDLRAEWPGVDRALRRFGKPYDVPCGSIWRIAV